NRALATISGPWWTLPVGAQVTVASRISTVPAAVAAATRHAGGPPARQWVAMLGDPHATGRVLFMLFAGRTPQPKLVVKLARLRGFDTPFESERRALAAVAGISGVVGHVPDVRGRF